MHRDGGPHLGQPRRFEQFASQKGPQERVEIGRSGDQLAGGPTPARVYPGEVEQFAGGFIELVTLGMPAADTFLTDPGRIGVVQAYPLDDPDGDQLVERPAGDPLGDQAGQQVVGVAVGPVAGRPAFLALAMSSRSRGSK
ncbi:hypothetical protein GCM10029963_40560 [Micromonospora andamanensis]